MIQENILQKFEALPPEARHQLIEFMEFLTAKYSGLSHNENFTPPDKTFDESFIGIWQDRKDMQDSNLWLRNLRNSEWALKDD
jgi:hypothetical protein